MQVPKGAWLNWRKVRDLLGRIWGLDSEQVHSTDGLEMATTRAGFRGDSSMLLSG